MWDIIFLICMGIIVIGGLVIILLELLCECWSMTENYERMVKLYNIFGSKREKIFKLIKIMIAIIISTGILNMIAMVMILAS